jgi:hypothetical protein
MLILRVKKPVPESIFSLVVDEEEEEGDEIVLVPDSLEECNETSALEKNTNSIPKTSTVPEIKLDTRTIMHKTKTESPGLFTPYDDEDLGGKYMFHTKNSIIRGFMYICNTQLWKH